MSLKIGRCGIDVALGDHSSLSMTPDGGNGAVAMDVWLTASSEADARILRQQLLGHIANPWEPVIPIVSTVDTTLTGYYTLLDGSVSNVLGISDTARGTYGLRAQIKARRVGGYSAPRIETQFGGTNLVTAHSIVASDTHPWHGTPAAEQGYQFGAGNGAYSTRVGPGGTARIRDLGGAVTYFSNFASWGCPPANWYDMASTIKVGAAGSRRDVVGRQFVSAGNELLWEISNGLVKFVAGNSGTGLIRIQSPIFATPASVGTAVNIDVGYYDAGWFSWGSANIIGVAPQRVSPECCTLRLYVATVPGIGAYSQAYTLDITLRRGSRHAALTIKSALSGKWGIATTAVTALSAKSVTVASGAHTVGVKQTAADADGNKLLMWTGKAQTHDLVNGRIYCTSSVESAEMFLGHEVGGASAAAIDDDDVVIMQGFAAQTAQDYVVIP